MPHNPFEMPDSDIFDQMKGNPFPQAPNEIFPGPKPTSGLGGGGSAGGAVARAREEARKREEEKEWENDFVGLAEHKPEPVEDPIEIKPKATLKKVGWVKAESYFNADAEVFAEFDVPDVIKNKKRVDFQLLHKQDGVFKVVATVSGYNDSAGHVTVVLPVDRPSPKSAEEIYTIKVNHCSGAQLDWSKGIGTERRVTETAAANFEHIKISGLHFSRNKSFLAPPYLKVLPKLIEAYRDWKRSHDGAKIIIYAHADLDEDGPKKLSMQRAQAIFSFINKEPDVWFDISQKEWWGVWEHQSILSELKFYHGKVDGEEGPKTRKAIADFQLDMNTNHAMNLRVDYGLDSSTRRAMYKQYMNYLRHDMLLPQTAFRLVDGRPYVGCSIFNRYNGESGPHSENRRAVFVVVKESKHFPMYFPCRSESTETCEKECQNSGSRAKKSFGCKFYDEMVKEERVVACEPVGGKSSAATPLVCNDAPPPVLTSELGTCHYYLWRIDNFVERHKGCTQQPPDYYKNYGYKYCVRFGTETSPKLSSKGKVWLQKARRYLQQKMEKELKLHPNLELDSPRFTLMAFGTHSNAYWEAGLEGLPLTDLVIIGFTPDITEWLDNGTRAQAYDIAGRLVIEWKKDLQDAAKNQMDDITDYFSKIL